MMKRLGKVRIDIFCFHQKVLIYWGYKKQYIRNFKPKGRWISESIWLLTMQRYINPQLQSQSNARGYFRLTEWRSSPTGLLAPKLQVCNKRATVIHPNSLSLALSSLSFLLSCSIEIYLSWEWKQRNPSLSPIYHSFDGEGHSRFGLSIGYIRRYFTNNNKRFPLLMPSILLEVHAIGDYAAEVVLDAFEAAGVTAKDRPLLTHCQILAPDLFERMVKLGT